MSPDEVSKEVQDPRAAKLAEALRAWWASEQDSWEDGLAGDPHLDQELYEDMPELDSKMVARTSGLFEEHLGIPLEVDLIPPKGYDSIEEMIDHLVPAMVEIVTAKGGGT